MTVHMYDGMRECCLVGTQTDDQSINQSIIHTYVSMKTATATHFGSSSLSLYSGPFWSHVGHSSNLALMKFYHSNRWRIS